MRMYEDLRQLIPTLGMVFDCCMKPSHDLGRMGYFQAFFSAMRRFLLDHGIRVVVTACPNCTVIFRRYAPEITVRFAYDLLGLPPKRPSGQASGMDVSVHDPCPLRGDPRAHKAIRDLLTARGYNVIEMRHRGRFAACCGEGGAVGAVRPEFSARWARIRQQEAGGRTLVTYCAGCVASLQRVTPIVHIGDLLYGEKSAGRSWGGFARAPWTYGNRLLLQYRCRHRLPTVLAGPRSAKGIHAAALQEKSGESSG